MTKFFVYPYTQNSRSAKALAEALEGKRVLREGSSYKYSEDHVLINWGCGDCPHSEALNPGYAIIDLINKKSFFNRLKGTGLTPDFATTLNGAQKLGYPVFCRTNIEGHDGKGIIVADCEGQLVDAPLYVKGIDKTSEYRVHVGREYSGKVTILGGAKKGQKAITPEMKNVPRDTRIWCGDTTFFGDFVGAHSLPMEVNSVVQEAFNRFPELSFAAFDVVYDNSEGKAYVIEANSAPMATPETTKAYARFFQRYAEDKNLANFAKKEQAVVATAPATPIAAAPAAAPVRSKDEIAKDIAASIVELIETLVPKG
jgi:hypothetical protein